MTSFSCDNCLNLTVTCSSCSKHFQTDCNNSNNNNYDNWICSQCTLSVLPYNHIQNDIEFRNVISDIQGINNYAESNLSNIFDLQTNFIERGNDPFIHNDPDNQL